MVEDTLDEQAAVASLKAAADNLRGFGWNVAVGWVRYYPDDSGSYLALHGTGTAQPMIVADIVRAITPPAQSREKPHEGAD
jgi:hypothetical protein